jgi:hypothetical protein
LYVYAQIAIDLGNFNEARQAIDRYQKAIVSNPATTDADWRGRYELLEATMANRNGDIEQARQRATAALALFKDVQPKAIIEINDAKALLQQSAHSP